MEMRCKLWIASGNIFKYGPLPVSSWLIVAFDFVAKPFMILCYFYRK